MKQCTKIADAEARIALLEKTAGIRDDVLAAMQDELDNLPIFVSAAQKDAFRLKEPGDAKNRVHAFRISDQSWRTQLACHQEN